MAGALHRRCSIAFIQRVAPVFPIYSSHNFKINIPILLFDMSCLVTTRCDSAVCSLTCADICRLSLRLLACDFYFFEGRSVFVLYLLPCTEYSQSVSESSLPLNSLEIFIVLLSSISPVSSPPLAPSYLHFVSRMAILRGFLLQPLCLPTLSCLSASHRGLYSPLFSAVSSSLVFLLCPSIPNTLTNSAILYLQRSQFLYYFLIVC